MSKNVEFRLSGRMDNMAMRGMHNRLSEQIDATKKEYDDAPDEEKTQWRRSLKNLISESEKVCKKLEGHHYLIGKNAVVSGDIEKIKNIKDEINEGDPRIL